MRLDSGTDGPLVVEFVGLPGAGKTTAARHVLEELEARGYACGSRGLVGRTGLSRAAHYTRVVRFCVRQASELSSAVLLGLPASGVTAARVRHALKLSSWSYRLTTRARGYDVTILDQGPVQQACSTMLHGRIGNERAVAAALRGVLRAAQARFAYVYFDIDVDLAVLRIAGRPAGRSSFGRLKGEAAKPGLATYQRRLGTLLDFAEAATGAARLRVDAARPVDEVSARIVEFIEAVRDPRPAGAPP